MFFQFILLDTTCEDVGVMLNIPVAEWFRLPATRGGVPISVSTTGLRVGVQLVLEAMTDLAAFFIYATLKQLPEE
jgi:hypothetical protein